MKPSPPDHLPSSDAEWDAFLKGLDHEEDGEAPSSSMLSFVLKNLRHGADLSKMPLPTWFLQKRSILEAYSDFFRNSDEFVKIAKQKSPQARMEQCLRWFLVGFNAHFHKLTNIAKKPFNSILGETFTGEFVLDKNCKEKNVDSPWPWTSTNNLIFSGEQVSHHPPISAFYVECSSARIYADCHLMVVAKFRGFHVKAKNIGSMNVHLPDQGEEYVVKLPNGYGRSLFTTPWVEAGDEGSITCAKTGYSVEMKFHTKSLFGSERNKMEAKMTGPPNSANQPVYFQGNWDTQIFKSLSEKSSKEDLWIDMKRQPVRPLLYQSYQSLPENDSRKVWREVAWCIQNRIQEKANEFKVYLEEVQRREKALRDDRQVVWTPALFKGRTAELNKSGYMPWDFKNSLSRRKKKAAPPPLTAIAATPEPSVPAPEVQQKPTVQNRNEDPILIEDPPFVNDSTNQSDAVAVDSTATHPILHADVATEDEASAGEGKSAPEEVEAGEAGRTLEERADAREGGELNAAEGERDEETFLESGAVDSRGASAANDTTGTLEDSTRDESPFVPKETLV